MSPALTAAEQERLQARDVVRGMVPTLFPRLLAEHLQRLGVDPADVLPAAAQQAARSALGRYPVEQWCQLLLAAARRLDDPLLGLHLGQSLQPAHLGALGYLLGASDTLGAALLHVQRYHRLINDLNPVGAQVRGDALALVWGVTRGKPGALFDETGICAMVQCARLLCGQPFPVLRVDFVNPPPARTQPFVDFLGGPVRWNQPATRLVLAVDVLKLPLQRADPTLHGLMEQQIDAALASLPEAGELPELTRQIVQRLAGQGPPALEQVAAELRLSPRALYRGLARRGHQFRQLRDDSLRELAERWLGDGSLSLAEISGRLGYSEQSAFTRAFRRWSGESPLAWRRRRVTDDAP